MQMHAQELYITLKKTKYYNYDVNSYAHNEFSERFPSPGLLQNMRNRRPFLPFPSHFTKVFLEAEKAMVLVLQMKMSEI